MSFWRRQMPVLTALLVFVLFVLATGARHRDFLEPDVFWNILRDNAFLGIVAAGEAYVILSGGIDLSVGAVLGFTSVLIATLIGAHIHPVTAMLLCLGLGTAFGATMGWVIAYFEVPPFLVTLAGMFLPRGAAFVITTESAVISHPLYDKLAETTWLSPLLFGAVVLIGHYVLNFQPFGRAVYALGGGEDSAHLMGVRTSSTKIGIYAISGFCSALGSIVYTFYTVSGDPTAGGGLELDAITAVVIGGTLLSGGYGGLVGTVVGVLILRTVQNALTYESNISSWWARIVVGGLLLLFLLIQRGVEGGMLAAIRKRHPGT